MNRFFNIISLVLLFNIGISFGVGYIFPELSSFYSAILLSIVNCILLVVSMIVFQIIKTLSIYYP